MKATKRLVEFTYRTDTGFEGNHVAVFQTRNCKILKSDLRAELKTIGVIATAVRIDWSVSIF